MNKLNVFKCKNFRIEELVSEKVFKKYGEQSWQFFDINILIAIDLLRDDFGPCTVNDWLWHGRFSESGLRSLDYGGVENRSLHKHGKAVDLKFKNIKPHEIRKRILANPQRYWMIKGVEMKTDSWVHIDTRNVDTRKRFFTFNP